MDVGRGGVTQRGPSCAVGPRRGLRGGRRRRVVGSRRRGLHLRPHRAIRTELRARRLLTIPASDRTPGPPTGPGVSHVIPRLPAAQALAEIAVPLGAARNVLVRRDHTQVVAVGKLHQMRRVASAYSNASPFTLGDHYVRAAKSTATAVQQHLAGPLVADREDEALPLAC